MWFVIVRIRGALSSLRTHIRTHKTRARAQTLNSMLARAVHHHKIIIITYLHSTIGS
jgi:hypothetical protein